jgi:glutathione S-transferase
VIPGSHACRSAMLMLEHKGIGYEAVELPTGLHPVIVRLLGFPGSRTPIRTLDGESSRSLTMMDRLGTVPALLLDGRRVQTNRAIARHLDEQRPQPPLFPAEQERRAQVEEAEDQVLQMAARRIVMAASARGLDELEQRGARGRLGSLLAHRDVVRLHASRTAGRLTFRAGAANERELLGSLGPLLDRVDRWVEAGVLGAESPNAADMMVAPSLALLAYRRDIRGEIERRPAGALMERLLPEPAPAAA